MILIFFVLITARVLSIKSQCPLGNNAITQDKTVFVSMKRQKRQNKKRRPLSRSRQRGERMIDVETMIKALRLAWIPRLFAPGRKNWKTTPDYYLGR